MYRHLFRVITVSLFAFCQASSGGPAGAAPETRPATQPTWTEHRIDDTSVLKIKREDLDLATIQDWPVVVDHRKHSGVQPSDARKYTFIVRTGDTEREVAHYRLALFDGFFAGISDSFELFDACVVDGHLALLIGKSGFHAAGLKITKLEEGESVDIGEKAVDYGVLDQHNAEHAIAISGGLKVVEKCVLMTTLDAKAPSSGRQFTIRDRLVLHDGKFERE